ncbi:MAG: sensor histidine kinase, partial [Chloroflexota bacterium]
ELHDEIAQGLATLSLGIDTITRDRKELSEGTVDALKDIRDRSHRLSEEVSRLSHALRPVMLDQLGLLAAVELLVIELGKTGGVAARLEVDGEGRRLSAEVELGLYRIIQEAVSNITKHSQAQNAVVTLKFRPDRVTATIADDGKGFETSHEPGNFAAMGKLGLLGMQERAQLLKGSLSLQSRPGKGTTVTVTVNLLGTQSRVAVRAMAPVAQAIAERTRTQGRQ